MASDSRRILAELQGQFAVGKDKKIAEQLAAEIEQSESAIKYQLIKDNPFGEHQLTLAAAQKDFGGGVFDLPAIQSDFESYKKLTANATTPIISESFWANEIAQLSKKQPPTDPANNDAATIAAEESQELREDMKTLRGLLQSRWQKTLNEEHAKWEEETIAEHRRQLLEKLNSWLGLMQQLSDSLAQLGVDANVLFDLSKNNLSLSDMAQIKRWAKYFTQDKGVRELCEMLGRLRVAMQTKRKAWISNNSIAEIRPDINSREEIVGVRIGKDIEHALPQELALLADPDTALLFDIKWTENRLMCFDMVGSQTSDDSRHIFAEISEEEKMGPMIICVDTSGSMQGQPETVAKAVTLYMATKAIEQKRNCLLINFSNGIETMDLSGHVNIANLIKFLEKSFIGGTDAAPAVEHALHMMKNNKYEKSDMLIISDFLMNQLPDSQRGIIAAAKQNNNKFYSLTVGNEFLGGIDKNIFDGEWVYDPQKHNIRQLIDIADKVKV